MNKLFSSIADAVFLYLSGVMIGQIATVVVRVVAKRKRERK